MRSTARGQIPAIAGVEDRQVSRAGPSGHRVGRGLHQGSARIACKAWRGSRLRRALEAGWDPETLTDQYNAAAAERRAAEAELAALVVPDRLSAGDIQAMVDQLGDMAKVLDQAPRSDVAELYAALDLVITYDHQARAADVSISQACLE